MDMIAYTFKTFKVCVEGCIYDDIENLFLAGAISWAKVPASRYGGTQLKSWTGQVKANIRTTITCLCITLISDISCNMVI